MGGAKTTVRERKSKKEEEKEEWKEVAVAGPHAGDFIDAIPSPPLNLNLDSRSFGAVMCWRLGLKLMPSEECRAENCSRLQDEYGDHALHCRDDHGMKGGRHDRIRDIIYKEAQLASLSPTLEMPGLIPGSLSRPGDVFIPTWINGKKVAFDISVVSPTQDAVLHRAAVTPGAAIEMRKATKNSQHFDHCRSQGIDFLPLVVETFGSWDSDAVKCLKDMARHCARRWGKNNPDEIKHFFQRISIALQRGNASLLIERDVEPNSV